MGLKGVPGPKKLNLDILYCHMESKEDRYFQIFAVSRIVTSRFYQSRVFVEAMLNFITQIFLEEF